MALEGFGPGVLSVPGYGPAIEGVAPPGWEHTVKKMKKSGDIDNPWALAWYMKNRHMHPAKHEEDASYDAVIAQALAELQGRDIPAVCLAAARGEAYAMAHVLEGSQLLLEARWR